MFSRDSISQLLQKVKQSDQATFVFRKKEERKKSFFLLQTGNTLNSHKDFIDHLKKQVSLQEVSTVAECDFILVFCPVVSRAGTDVEAALKKLNNESDTKPAVLVVLHHTFDPECVVPDSSRAVHRENTVTVDCLFHEDKGLLQCHKNDESLSTVLDYINPQSTVRTEKQLDTGTNKNEALLDENRKLKEEILLLKQQLREKNNQPPQTEQIKEENLKQRDTQIKWKKEQGQENACTDNPLAHHEQNLQAVDPGTEERTIDKAEESNNAQHKRDKQLKSKYEDLQKEEQRLVKKMEKKVEEKQTEMNMEKEKLNEFKNYFKINKEVISERDAEIANLNEKFKSAVQEIEQKNTQLKNMNKLLSEKETQLKNTDKDLETSNNKLWTIGKELQCEKKNIKDMIIEQEKQKTKLQEKDKHLIETAQKMQMKDAALEKNKTLLKQIQTELDKKTKELEESQQHMEEKNTQLENLNKLLSEKETQLKNTDKELETSNNKLETLGQELQDKKRQLQEMMIILEEQKTKLAEKNKQLEEEKRLLTENTQILEQKGAQIKQEKGEDEKDALTGFGKSSATASPLKLEKKSQNKDQHTGDIKRHTENTNEVENNENTGALLKDAITKLQNTAKKPHGGKGAPHETDEQPKLNDTQEPQTQVMETEKNNKVECNKSSEKNEHEEDEDIQQNEKDLDRNQSLENNKNSSCEGKTEQGEIGPELLGDDSDEATDNSGNETA